MQKKFYRVDNSRDYKSAPPEGLVRLLPVKHGHAIFQQKERLEMLVIAIYMCEIIRISGPTGTGKTALIEALYRQPRNWQLLCGHLNLKAKPLRVFPVPLIKYETAGELFYSRRLLDGNTADEESPLLENLRKALNTRGHGCLWLQEFARMHSATVQNGLLSIMSRASIFCSRGEIVGHGGKIAIIMDDNLQDQDRHNYSLVAPDSAVLARATVNITIDYPERAIELMIVQQLTKELKIDVDNDVLDKVVTIANMAREERINGNLLSVTPPTLRQLLSFARLAHLTGYPAERLLHMTLFGCASDDDKQIIANLIGDVYGYRSVRSDHDWSELEESLF